MGRREGREEVAGEESRRGLVAKRVGMAIEKVATMGWL